MKRHIESRAEPIRTAPIRFTLVSSGLENVRWLCDCLRLYSYFCGTIWWLSLTCWSLWWKNAVSAHKYIPHNGRGRALIGAPSHNYWMRMVARIQMAAQIVHLRCTSRLAIVHFDVQRQLLWMLTLSFTNHS